MGSKDYEKIVAKRTDFDIGAAHKHFSVACFNKAWDLIEKSDRTPEEDEQMIRLSLSSHWHWTQRKDYSPKNASIAYWQTSRVFAVLNRGDEARRYGVLCLEVSQSEGIAPFFLGYAYEALARAEAVSANQSEMDEYLNQANQIVEKITDSDEKKMLLEDIATIRVVP
jgi:hypothetical protein